MIEYLLFSKSNQIDPYFNIDIAQFSSVKKYLFEKKNCISQKT